MGSQEKGTILLVSNEFPPGPGGIGTQAYQIATNLQTLGWKVHVAASQANASGDDIAEFNRKLDLKITSLSYHPFPPISFFSKWMTLLRIHSNLNPSHIISTGHTANFMIFLLQKIRRKPWLAIEHGHLPKGFEWNIKKWSLESADVVVCVSKFTKEITERAGVHFGRNAIIHNGADPAEFYEILNGVSKKEAFDVDETATVLLTVGNVSARKGQEIVIRALPQVLKHHPNVHYCMAGLRTIESELGEIARSLGVQDHVHFLGTLERAELLKAYNACDLFVMTSRHLSTEFEGFGIAVLEAALCGKPAVVSANSGLLEAIEEDVTGLAVNENDPEDTARGITTLLQDRQRMLNMGRAARDRTLKNFAWPEVVKKYEEVLQSL